tara:strand:- start:1178 stop:1468 length:291 start_codon:yes stop_codon:yes gene_type:complete
MSEARRPFVNPSQDASALGSIGVVRDGQRRSECIRDPTDCTDRTVDLLPTDSSRRRTKRGQVAEGNVEVGPELVEYVGVDVPVYQVVREQSELVGT